MASTFIVEYVAVNEVVRKEIEAEYYSTDTRNNLAFFKSYKDAEPFASFVAGRWISVEQKK